MFTQTESPTYIVAIVMCLVTTIKTEGIIIDAYYNNRVN